MASRHCFRKTTLVQVILNTKVGGCVALLLRLFKETLKTIELKNG